MSLENRMVFGGMAAASALVSAFQASMQSAHDTTGPEAVRILTDALYAERDRRLEAEAALVEAQEELIMLRTALYG